jgi:hypothetical protein
MRLTFEQACDEFLRFVEHVRQIDAASVKDYRGEIDGYRRDEFGELPIEHITPNLIDAYKERLIEEGRLSARVIVRHLTVLTASSSARAARTGSSATPPPRTSSSGPGWSSRASSTPSLGRRSNCSPARRTTSRTARSTGLPRSPGYARANWLALSWGDVDFVGGLLHVRHNYTDRREKMPKGKRVRSVPMTPRVVDTLARRRSAATCQRTATSFSATRRAVTSTHGCSAAATTGR